MFFVYDGFDFSVRDTEAEAKRVAEASLAESRNGLDPGWGDDVCWGRISEHVLGCGADLSAQALVPVVWPAGDIGYADVVNTVREYPITMLAGLFAEVAKLCIAKDVFRADGGMERCLSRIQSQVPKPGAGTVSQWWRSGDHPLDNAFRPFEDTGATPALPREGEVVRYFRHPAIPGWAVCASCGCKMDAHGWIDIPADGLKVCPGDYIVTDAKGVHSVLKPDVVEAICAERPGTK